MKVVLTENQLNNLILIEEVKIVLSESLNENLNFDILKSKIKKLLLNGVAIASILAAIHSVNVSNKEKEALKTAEKMIKKYKLDMNEEFKWASISERNYRTITLIDRKYTKNNLQQGINSENEMIGGNVWCVNGCNAIIDNETFCLEYCIQYLIPIKLLIYIYIYFFLYVFVHSSFHYYLILISFLIKLFIFIYINLF
jgi:hypothetical protein